MRNVSNQIKIKFNSIHAQFFDTCKNPSVEKLNILSQKILSLLQNVEGKTSKCLKKIKINLEHLQEQVNRIREVTKTAQSAKNQHSIRHIEFEDQLHQAFEDFDEKFETWVQEIEGEEIKCSSLEAVELSFEILDSIISDAEENEKFQEEPNQSLSIFQRAVQKFVSYLVPSYLEESRCQLFNLRDYIDDHIEMANEKLVAQAYEALALRAEDAADIENLKRVLAAEFTARQEMLQRLRPGAFSNEIREFKSLHKRLSDGLEQQTITDSDYQRAKRTLHKHNPLTPQWDNWQRYLIEPLAEVSPTKKKIFNVVFSVSQVFSHFLPLYAHVKGIESNSSWHKSPSEQERQVAKVEARILQTGPHTVISDIKAVLDELKEPIKGLEDPQKIILEQSVHSLHNQINRHETAAPSVISSPTYTQKWKMKGKKLEQEAKKLAKTAHAHLDEKKLLQQGQQSFEELKKMIDTPLDSSIKVDLNYLMHALGDIFGAGSSYEGNTSKVIWSYRLALIKLQAQVANSPEEKALYTDLTEKLDQAVQFIKNLDMDSPEKFQLKMKERIEALAPDESFFFNAGWVGSLGAHSMVGEIEKQTNGRYIFRLYNTGAGLDYHSFHIRGVQNKAAFIIEQSEIEPRRINSPLVWEAFRQLRTRKFEGWVSQDVYEKIFALLGGVFTPVHVPHENINTPQRAGFCTYAALTAWLSYQMGKQDKTRLQFEHRFKTLVEYYKQNREELQDNRSRQYFQQCLREFSQETAKAYANQHVIYDVEMQYTSRIIRDIELDLERLSELERRKKMLPALDFSKLNPHPAKGLPLEQQLYPSGVNSIEPSFATGYDSRELTYNYRLETVVADLQGIVNETRDWLDQKKGALAARELTRVFSQLPVSLIADSQDYEALLPVLNQLGVQFAYSLNVMGLQDPILKGMISPAQRVLQLKLLTWMHQLASKDGYSIQMKPYKLSEYITYEDSHFFTFDPSRDQELVELYKYWKTIGENFHGRFSGYYGGNDYKGKFQDCLQINHFVSEQWMPPKEVIKDAIFVFNEKYINEEDLKYFVFSGRPAYWQYKLIEEHHLLKPSFYALRNFYFLNAYSYYFSTSIEEGNFKLEDPVSIFIKFKDHEVGTKIFGKEVEYWSAPRDPFFIEIWNQPNRAAYFNKRDWGGNDWYGRRRTPPNKSLLSPTNEFEESSWSEISYQRIRELLSLMANSNLQLEKTLTFYRGHLSLLEDEDNLYLFQFLFFEPGLMHEQLNGPTEEVVRFTESGRLFLEGAFQYLHAIGKYENAAVVLQIMRRFAAYVNQAKPEIFLFPELPTLMREIMQDEHASDVARGIAARELAITYETSPRNSLTPERVLELLHAAAHFCLRDFTDYDHSYVDRLAHHQLLDVLDIHKEQIRLMIEADPQILNRIGEGLFTAKKWQVEVYPFLITEDKQVTYNAHQGSFDGKYGLKERLPNDIFYNREVNEFLNNKHPEKVWREGDSYRFSDKHGHTFQLTKTKGKAIQLEREFDGKWFAGPPSKYYSSINLPFDRFEAWHGKNSIILTHKTNAKPAIEILIGSKADPKDIVGACEDIIGLDENGRRNGLRLDVKMDNPLPQLLSRITDPKNVLVWRHIGEGQIVHLDLLDFPSILRLTLKDVRGIQRAYLSEPAGFYVVTNHNLPDYGFDSYFLIENEIGERQLLIHGSDYFFCPLLRDRLAPDPEVTRLALADVLLTCKHYARAQSYLVRLEGPVTADRSHLGVAAADELKFLNHILYNRDSDPRAIALRLQVGYRLLKEAKEFPLTSTMSEQTKEVTKEIYFAYLDKSKHMGGYVLREDQELFLLSLLPSHPIFENRKTALLTGRIPASSPTDTFGSHYQLERINHTSYLRNSLNYLTEDELDELCLVAARGVKPDITMQSPILRLPINYEFSRLYLAVRSFESSSLEENHQRLSVFMPLSMTATLQELKEDFKILLLYNLKISPQSDAIISLLLQVIDHPEAFPESPVKKWSYYSGDLKNEFSTLFKIAREQANTHGFDLSAYAKASPEKKIRLRLPPLIKHSKGKTKKLTKSQRSIAQKLPVEFKAPHLPVLGTCLVMEKVDSNKVELKEVEADLSKCFSVATEEPLTDRLFRQFGESVGNYIFEVLSSGGNPVYRLESPSDLEAQKRDLAVRSDLRGKRLAAEQDLILQLANRYPTDPAAAAEKHLRLTGGEEQALTIEDLVLLFLKRDVDAFRACNPTLQESDVIKLNEKLFVYLEEYTFYQHEQRMLKGIEEVQACQNLDDLNESIQKLMTMVAQRRVYSPVDHPEYLVFEYAMDILLYPKQVEKIDLLQIKNGHLYNPAAIGTVLEMMTGGGKTDVLTVLLAYLNADGEHLSTLVMTPTMVSNVGQKIATRLGMGLAQQVQVLQWNRKIDVLSDAPEGLLQRLESIIKNKQVLLVSNDILETLVLQFGEALLMSQEGPITTRRDYLNVVGTFRKIFYLFKTKGRLVLDEIDQILEANKEFIFTLEQLKGGQPRALKTTHVEVVLHLYKLLLLDPEWFFQHECTPENSGPHFSKDLWNQRKIALAEKLLNDSFGVTDPALIAFFNELSSNYRKLILTYLLAKQDVQAKVFVHGLEPSCRRVLDLVRAELNELIPLSFGSQDRIHYGADPSAKTEVAIPYKGVHNPLIDHHSGTPYEELNFTIQLYMKNGIPLKFVRDEILKLRTNYLEEIRQDNRLHPRDTQAQKALEELVGKDSGLSISRAEQELPLIQTAINKRPPAKFDFIKKYIVPLVKFYPLRLTIGPQIFGWMFNEVDGFSATPLSPETFPNNMQMLSENQAAGRTLTLLWQNRQNAIRIIASLPAIDHENPPRNLLTHLAKEIPEFDAHSVMIDMGGYFKEVGSNEDIVREWLEMPEIEKRQSHILAAHTFDNESKAQVIQPGKPSVPMWKSLIDKAYKIFFFSQKEITGVDEKFASRARALIFVSEHVTMRDLLQAVGRMRNLGPQVPTFIMTQEVAQLIKSTLTPYLKEPIQEITLEHLLLFGAYNQAVQKGDLIFRATKQKMLALIHAAFMEAALDQQMSNDEIGALFYRMKDMMYSQVEDDPTVIFGDTIQMKSDKAVDKELEKILKGSPVQALKTDPKRNKTPSVLNIEERLKDLAEHEKTLQAKEVRYTETSLGTQMQVQSQTQTQTQTQTNTKTQVNTQIEGRKVKYESALPVFTLTKEAFFKKSTYFCHSFLQDWYLYSLSFFIQESKSPIQENELQFGFLNTQLYEEGILFSPFDSRLMISTNLACEFPSSPWRIPCGIFNEFQKPAEALLIVQNKESGQFYPKLIDQNDYAAFSKFLKEDQQNPASIEREVVPCLISLGDPSLFIQGSERFAIEKLEALPEFYHWVVQGKYFNGETTYSAKEQEALLNWVKAEGANKVRDFFIERILSIKEESRKSYPGSDIAKIFEKALH